MGTISRSLRRRHGFSLIELAVVLIVIALIAAIAVPTFQTVIERSQDRAAVAGQQAVAREVNALIALEMDPLDALAAALADTSAAAGDKSVVLTWNTSAGASGYTVFQGTSDDFEAAESVASPVGATATVTGLTNGAQYWFWVVAVGAGGSSSPSDAVTATPAADGVFLRLRGSALEKSTDGLTWTDFGTPHGVTSPGWVSVVDGAVVVGSASASNYAKVSVDGGQTWVSMNEGFSGTGHEAGAGRLGSTFYLYGSTNSNMKGSTSWTSGWGWKWYPGNNVRDVAANGDGVALAATAGGLRRLTEAGMTTPSNANGAWSAVAWDGNQFIAIPSSTSGTSWRTSTDGASWTDLARSSGNLAAAIEGANGTFIAVVNGSIVRSVNGGTNWASVNSTLSGGASPDVATDGNGRWIVAARVSGAARYVVSFDDGVTWTTAGLSWGGTNSPVEWLPTS